MPNCWIIAGPNGAGKTTFALDYLPRIVNCKYFVNADLIAGGLSPFAPEHEQVTAGKLFIREIQRHISQKESFAFETTLAGHSYLKSIKQLQQDGWFVELIYLALPSIEMAKLGVTERVAHGGHSIPDGDH